MSIWIVVMWVLGLVGCTATTPLFPPSHTQKEEAVDPPRDVRQNEVRGEASWYGKRFQGQSTASGEPFNMHELTAAHKTFPFGTIVRVTRTDTLQSVVVRINDRGPYSKGRVIDLSKAAAAVIGLVRDGTAPVRVTILRWGDG